MRPLKTWILVADANRAWIAEHTKIGAGIHRLEDRTIVSNRTQDFRDGQGRSYKSYSSRRHKIEPKVHNDVVLTEHVDEIIQLLLTSLKKREFDRLIICVATQTLGIFRKRMPASLKEIVIAEMSKDLTHVPLNEIARYFEDVLAI
ncbi:MAG: host attachment protein [Rhizobiaceae bacterium]|nr:host attachment protein [Rhizobiaceae bacterium]